MLLGRVRGGSRKLNLKCFGYKLPQGSINQMELRNAHQPLDLPTAPPFLKSSASSFYLWHKDKLQNGPTIPSPRLSKQQISTEEKKLCKRISIWVEQRIYANEVVLRNYKHSGRLCASIKSTGWQPNLETESVIQPMFAVFTIHCCIGCRWCWTQCQCEVNEASEMWTRGRQ